MRAQGEELRLFGGDIKPWNSRDWTASDDRVRGGKSHSYLSCNGPTAVFRGDLDIRTLGGAGFASQRTTGEHRCWDLSAYDGIQLALNPLNSDGKRYTFILKDQLLERDPDTGREQATTSWEYDFDLAKASNGQTESQQICAFIDWQSLKPTYRGKEQKDAKPLNLAEIKRFSIMMRSFFGTQHGPFQLEIATVSAMLRPGSSQQRRSLKDEFNVTASETSSEAQPNSPVENQSIHRALDLWSWFFGRCWKL